MRTPAPGRDDAGAAAARDRRVTRVVVIFLLVGTIAAFAFAEALKLDAVPVADAEVRRVFSPTCDCAARRATLVFTLRERDTIDVEVVDEEGETVRVLARAVEQPRGRVTLRWSGRDDAGRVVADGAYRIRIRLEEAGRTLLLPRRIRVDTEPPTLTLLSARPRVLAARDELELLYRTDERSRAALVVDGEVATREGFRGAGLHSLSWDASGADGRAGAGTYDVRLRVRDRAGNAAETEPLRVRVR